MSSVPDRPKPIKDIAIARNPNVDSLKGTSDTWLKILIICFVLFVGIMFFMIVDARISYQYRIAVNGRGYQCNVIERGNPTYLKDCWQGDNITIYDPVNMVVVE